jgi:hypothetical protein
MSAYLVSLIDDGSFEEGFQGVLQGHDPDGHPIGLPLLIVHHDGQVPL